MQTELKVIDLGERGGKVVRRFPKTLPYYSYDRPAQAINFYIMGYLDMRDLVYILYRAGYGPSDVVLLGTFAEVRRRRCRKEVNHD